MDISTPRSRVQVATATGVKIGLLRSLEEDGLLPAGNLTVADELVVRALTWADGARAGDREHERTLARKVREVLATAPPTDAMLVLVDGEVMVARDQLEALLLVRGRRGVVALVPLGVWLAEMANAA